MNLHTVRENETLEDLSLLYSIKEQDLLKANMNKKPVSGMEYIIPVNGVYLFLKEKEEVANVLREYNVNIDDFLLLNKEILTFKDESIRILLPNLNQKKIKICSLVDLSLAGDIFIEGDLESEYINEIYGVFDREYRDFVSYIKKIEYVDEINSGIVFNKIDATDLNFILSENFNHIILNVELKNKEYMLNVIKILKSKNVEVSFLCEKFDVRDVDFINENFDNIILLPTSPNIKVDLRIDEYNLFLQGANLFLKEKLIVGINLNGSDDIKSDYEIVKEIYNRDFAGICLYMCSNRKYYMKYIINHFFHI